MTRQSWPKKLGSWLLNWATWFIPAVSAIDDDDAGDDYRNMSACAVTITTAFFLVSIITTAIHPDVHWWHGTIGAVASYLLFGAIFSLLWRS